MPETSKKYTRKLPCECEHAEECGVQVTGIVVTLDTTVLATKRFYVSRTTAEGLYSPRDGWTVDSSKF